MPDNDPPPPLPRPRFSIRENQSNPADFMNPSQDETPNETAWKRGTRERPPRPRPRAHFPFAKNSRWSRKLTECWRGTYRNNKTCRLICITRCLFVTTFPFWRGSNTLENHVNRIMSLVIKSNNKNMITNAGIPYPYKVDSTDNPPSLTKQDATRE